MLNRTFVLLLLIFAGPSFAKEITLEAIHSDKGLSGPRLRSPKFSPDNTQVTFLKSRPDNAKRYDLWSYQIASGKSARLVNADDLHQGQEILSDHEKSRRERMRISASGIISYQWAKDGKSLLFPLAGDLYHYDISQKSASQLTKTQAFELDARFSPDGKKVAFIREHNLLVLDLKSGIETALTTDGKGPVKNGMSEFVAQEEMSRYTGYWWGPDSKKIAYIRYDESAVAEIQRNEIYADRIETITQRYPYTGAANVSLQLAVVSLADRQHQQIDLGTETDIYLPRVDWSNDGNLLTYQWQSRNQQRLELRQIALDSQKENILVSETSPTWINLHKDLHFLKNGIVWASERSGFKHLYRIIDGTITPLTAGQWKVNRLTSIDEEKGWAYFTGWIENPTEQNLYRVKLDGSTASEPTQISQRKGWHNITFSDNAHFYLDRYSNPAQPTQVSLHRADGSQLAFLSENKLDETHPLTPYLENWIAPTFGSLKTDHGTALHYKLFKPTLTVPEGGFPVIVYVYGGPGAQQVRNSWSGRDLWAQYMLARGFVVFTLDNRGSSNRGKAFEDVLYKRFGDYELRDQIRGANWLKEQAWVDPSRIGIHGHSYGGYMTLMAMFRAGDTFSAGVAGAAVTDFRLYDTHYTERFLSTPHLNPEGYEATSVFPHTAGLSGDLLIYHGMADDNVLFTNATKLVSKLQKEVKLFEFMAYPGEKHGLSKKENRLHLAKTISEFFERKLGK